MTGHELLESVLQYAPDFFAHITPDGRFLFLNRFVAGLAQSDLEGRTIYDFVAPEDHPKVRAAIARTIETKQAQEYETTGVGPDRSVAHYFTRIAPVMTGDQVRSVVLIATDVTRLKELEAHFAHSIRLESLARLAGGVASDFGSALDAISSSLNLVLTELPPSSPALKLLQDACEVAKRSNRLAGKLVTFARQRAFEPRSLDLNVVIRDLDGVLRHVLGDDVEIVKQLTAQRNIYGDHSLLTQAVLGLASSSRGALVNGGAVGIRTSVVRLASEPKRQIPPGSYVKLEFSDTGTGIAREDLDRVFEPFYTTKDGRAGGLELAMVHGIVTQHGGYISVSSAPGHGAVFEVLLPTIDSDSSPPTAGNETILVVEDEALVRSSMVKALTRAGYRVLEASNGVEALEVSRSYPGRIDLLLSDVVMPEMGGIELVRQLAMERPSTPTLLVSGYADERHGSFDKEIDLLTKPFSTTVLLGRIRQRLVKGS